MDKINIGISVNPPEKTCTDSKCPFHGSLRVRGRMYTGVVVSSKMNKTAVVEWTRKHFIPKYERFEKRKTKLRVHNPSCIDAKEGEKVRIIETRQLSKTKNFVIIEKLGEDIVYKEKKQTIEADKEEMGKRKDGSVIAESSSEKRKVSALSEPMQTENSESEADDNINNSKELSGDDDES